MSSLIFWSSVSAFATQSHACIHHNPLNLGLLGSCGVSCTARFVSSRLSWIKPSCDWQPFWNSLPGEVLARTRRRVARSISFGSRRHSAGFILTWRPPLSSHPQECTQRRPTRCPMAAVSRPHHQWIQPHFRSVPRVIKFSLLHTDTNNITLDEMKHPSAK